jgi:hypothetical protein
LDIYLSLVAWVECEALYMNVLPFPDLSLHPIYTHKNTNLAPLKCNGQDQPASMFANHPIPLKMLANTANAAISCPTFQFRNRAIYVAKTAKLRNWLTFPLIALILSLHCPAYTHSLEMS